jgi:hypothetical protein
MKEAKRYDLRPARTPQKDPRLSGVVSVLSTAGSKISFIHFNEAFVEAVGKELPKGVSPDNPAFIRVMQSGKAWKVFAMYLKSNEGCLLWESEQIPAWIGKQHPPMTKLLK